MSDLMILCLDVLIFLAVLACIYYISKKSNTTISEHNSSDNIPNKEVPKHKGEWYDTYYDMLLHTPEWKDYRERILDLHKHTCDWCGSHENLCVHHKLYYKRAKTDQFVNPWEYPNDKVMCLCESCHKRCHEKYQIKTYYRKY